MYRKRHTPAGTLDGNRFFLDLTLLAPGGLGSVKTTKEEKHTKTVEKGWVRIGWHMAFPSISIAAYINFTLPVGLSHHNGPLLFNCLQWRRPFCAIRKSIKETVTFKVMFSYQPLMMSLHAHSCSEVIWPSFRWPFLIASMSRSSELRSAKIFFVSSKRWVISTWSEDIAVY